jgi:chemotaxis signal transduction protein
VTTRDPIQVLAARARALAVRDLGDNAHLTEELATFTVDNQYLGIPMARVSRVAVLHHMTEIPGGPPWLIGMIAVEGHLVSLLDVTAFLGLGRRGARDITSALLVTWQGREIGIAAEQLLGIEDVPLADIGVLADSGPFNRVARLGKRDLLLLDVVALFGDPRLARGAQ